MQTIEVNNKNDAINTNIDYDLLYKELELCFMTCGKTFYVRPRALVDNQFYNENGKAIKRAPAMWKYYDKVFERRYSKVLVEAMTQRGFECEEVVISYLDKLSEKEKVNCYLLHIHWNWNKKRSNLLEFQDAWKEELIKLFPSACKFEFEENGGGQLITFTIPEFE